MDLSPLCLIVPQSGRSISDKAWQTIEPAHIGLWKAAVILLGERKLIYDKTNYAVAIDWTPTLRRHERHYSAMRYIENNRQRELNDRLERADFPRRSSKNEIRVSPKSHKHNLSSVVTSAIYDIFLIMNIAGPGCCDFHRASLLRAPYETDVSLSNIHFESALQVYLDHGWPTSRVLELGKVISWFNSVRQGTSQVPQNPMERVLFALLHMSKIDTSPMTVIWLFYAFESLLQTRAGENFSSIVRRLCLLLEANKPQSDILKKKMRALYDIRSAIVHGGFEVAHPMHDEVLDKRVEDSFGRLLDATDYGHAILLSSIQKTIENGWRFPRFDEVVGGDAV
jgi:hypothetical protein